MENAEKKKIIKDLNKLLEATKSAENKALTIAIGRLSSAGKNPDQAYELLINAKKILIEKTDERKAGLSARLAANNYRDWLEKEAKRYQNDPALKGLMIQYQWGALVLKARLKENMLKATGALEPLDLTEFKQPAMALLNAYVEACADPAFIQGATMSGGKRNEGGERRGMPGIQLAQKSVLSTDVGEVLGIGNMSAEGFPESLNNVEKVIDTLYLDEYRKSRNAEGIRSTWNKKITLRITLNKNLNDVKHQGDKKERKGPEDKEFTENQERIRTNMRWQCENDCFDAGDQVISVGNMLSIIKATVDPIEKENKINALKAKLTESMRSASNEKPAEPIEEQDSPYTITTKYPMDEDGRPLKKKTTKPSPAPKNEKPAQEEIVTPPPAPSTEPKKAVKEEATPPVKEEPPRAVEEKTTKETEEEDNFFDDM